MFKRQKKFHFFKGDPLPIFFRFGIFGAMKNFTTSATLNRRWWRGL
jgi:hypothetical protein